MNFPVYFSNGFDIAQFSLDPKRKDLNKKNTQVQKGKQRQYELTKTQVDKLHLYVYRIFSYLLFLICLSSFCVF